MGITGEGHFYLAEKKRRQLDTMKAFSWGKTPQWNTVTMFFSRTIISAHAEANPVGGAWTLPTNRW